MDFGFQCSLLVMAMQMVVEEKEPGEGYLKQTMIAS